MINLAYDSGVDIILILQSLGGGLITPMQFFTFLGNEEFFILFIPILYWSVNAILGLRLGILLMLSSGLVSVLKLAFHSPRPFWYSASVCALTEETSFGVPSGHAMNGISMWGLLAVYLRRTWSWVALLALVLLIGLSRVALGVHFPVDVVAGWFFGVLVLWIFLLLEAPVLVWLGRQTLAIQILAAFAVSLAFIVTSALVRASLGGFELPAGWLENAAAELQMEEPIDPLGLSDIITSSGALFGLVAGAIWLYDRSGFDASGTLANRFLRYPIGLIGVFILWYGLGLIFPRGEFLGVYILRYIRYCLVGVWTTALAPLLFIRLGLAGTGEIRSGGG